MPTTFTATPNPITTNPAFIAESIALNDQTPLRPRSHQPSVVFNPDGIPVPPQPQTVEEWQALFAQSQADIAAGRVHTWDDVKKELDAITLVTIVHVGHTHQNNQTIFTDS